MQNYHADKLGDNNICYQMQELLFSRQLTFYTT